MDAEPIDSTDRVLRLLAKGYARALLAKARERSASSAAAHEVIPGTPADHRVGDKMDASQSASIAAGKHRIALEFVKHNIPIGEWLHDSHTGIWTLSYGNDERAVFTISKIEMREIAGGDVHRCRELRSRVGVIAAALQM